MRASRDKVFDDVSMFDLHLSWEAYFYGGCGQKSVQPSLWSYPPAGVMKLNFFF